MAHAGSTDDRSAGPPLQRVVRHRKLVAKTFPLSASEVMSDSPAVSKDLETFHSAASQGILSSILVMLKDGRFCRDLPDRYGRTPLHWAAEQGRRKVVLALLRAGASANLRSQHGATPIMLAASNGHDAVVRLLLPYRAESDCWPLNRHRRGSDHWRSTALHCAAAGGHKRTVKLLLDAGFYRGQQDRRGVTPAEVSARASHPRSAEITRLLLPKSDRGGKLLYGYVDTQVEDVTIVSGLVKGGAFLDWQDKTGETSLHRAVHLRHATVLRVLLQAGADPNICDQRSASPLHVAAGTECGDIVPDLLEARADLELLMDLGRCPLHMAIGNNRTDVVSLLLNAGAFTEHRDGIHGLSPLSWACILCLAPIVRMLLEAGADVESTSLAGLTPLHWACRFNDAESVEVLLQAGADPGAVDQAATGAVALSSPSSDTSVSRAVAVDVIGLGYTLDRTEDLMRPFTGGSLGLTARRSDLASVKRIKSALEGANQER